MDTNTTIHDDCVHSPYKEIKRKINLISNDEDLLCVGFDILKYKVLSGDAEGYLKLVNAKVEKEKELNCFLS